MQTLKAITMINKDAEIREVEICNVVSFLFNDYDIIPISCYIWRD